MTEAEAIRLCQEGSPDAFRHLVEQHKNTLFGTAVLMTGDRAAAEEHVQEAFLSAWRGISGFRRGSPFKPWVVRILVNRIVSSRRARALPTAPLEDAERVTRPRRRTGVGHVRRAARRGTERPQPTQPAAPPGGGPPLLRGAYA